MKTSFWLTILALIMNGTIGMTESAFGLDLIENGGLINFDQIIQDQDDLAQSVGSNSTGLNTALTFGDFVKGTQVFIDFLTLQYFADIVQFIVQMVTDIEPGNFNNGAWEFIIMIRAVCAVIGIFGIVYMFTGRGTESNA